MAEHYDGFISYSHAADGLLAPRLQSGLQRFAKPWWQRRALRIFRDESSLSANPHLWSSITEALDSSVWFVLLLSPDAAGSPWVNQEIEYWKAHRDPARILPVVTNGEFEWVDGEVTGTAVPEQLVGVFEEEPRWVDLRFAQDDTDLDLKDPRFADAVADIASALRDVPKDELASEEVKQHRRTTRTAWGAGVLVTLLAVAATLFAFQSADNAREAQRQAGIAAQNAQEAQANAEAEAEARQQADTNAEAEALARRDAENQARLARARELGASALEALDEDPELATLLALESLMVVEVDPPGFLVDTVWEAAQANHLHRTLTPGEGEEFSIDLSPDGTRLVAVDDVGTVAMLDAPGGELVWKTQLDTTDVPIFARFHPNGSMLAISIADAESSWGRDRDNDQLPNRVAFLDATDGSEIAAKEYPNCLSAGAWGGWSPDGAVIAVSSGWDLCPREGTSGMWLEILDGATFESLAVFDAPSTRRSGPINIDYTEEGDLYASFWPGTDVMVIRGPDYSESEVLAGVDGNGAVSPDGSLVATFSNRRPGQMALFDAETGVRTDVYELDTFPSLVDGIQFSPNGRLLAVASEGRDTVVFNVVNGTELLRLPGGFAVTPTFSPDGDWLYTGHGDSVKVWDLRPQTLGQTVVQQLDPTSHIQKGFHIGPELGSAALINTVDEGFEIRTMLFDAHDGSIVSELPEVGRAHAMADGRFVLVRGWETLVYDPATGSETLIDGCISSDDTLCDDTGEPIVDRGPHLSLDGTEIMLHSNQSGEWMIVSPEDGSVLEVGSFPVREGFGLPFTEEWIMSFVNFETLTVLDRQTGDEIVTVQATLDAWDVSADQSLFAEAFDGEVDVVDLTDWSTRKISADIDRARGAGFSPSGRYFAAGDENQIVVVDLESRSQVRSIPVGGASDLHWLDEETILVGTVEPARWVTVSLDVSSLATEAAEGVTRGFTEEECQIYRIDPCPSLEEMRGG